MEATASEFSYNQKANNGDHAHFIVEDLLDFSNDDNNNGPAFDNLTAGNSNSGDSSSTVVTPLDTCNSSFDDLNFLPSGHPDNNNNFSGDLCVPYDDLAELEWLSNFVEESFSSEDLQKFQLISGMSALKTRPDGPDSQPRYYQPDPPRPVSNGSSSAFSPEMPVPAKARSKRSRAAGGNWASRLGLLLSPTSSTNASSSVPRSPAEHGPEVVAVKPVKSTPKKKGNSLTSGARSGPDGSVLDPAGPGGEVRRCLHCATDKTPQWRTGPMGPKTLCNACGVRYKSGRLVPEYRPAASPTFVLTKHSNSHRKVMELRRQKEQMKHQHYQQQQHYQHPQLIHNPNNSSGSMMFDQPNSDDYLIHQHIGPDFRQLI